MVSEKVQGWTGLVVEASPRLVRRITALSIENSRPGRQSYADILAPAGYRQVAVLGWDEIWLRASAPARPSGQ